MMETADNKKKLKKKIIVNDIHSYKYLQKMKENNIENDVVFVYRGKEM